jgi:hypothetical protein
MLKFNIIKFLASTNLQLLAEKQNGIQLQKKEQYIRMSHTFE